MSVLLFIYFWGILIVLAAHPEAWASLVPALLMVVTIPKLYALWQYSKSNLNANA